MQASKKKKLIIANSFLLIFLLVGFVFAWFASNYNNNVNSNDVTVIADNSLELSLDNVNWSSSLNLSKGTDWFSSVAFTDITGSGDGRFLRPELTQFNDHAEVSSWATDPVPRKDYVKFTLYMRSYDPLNIYLGNGSEVSPSVGMDKLVGNDAANLSPFSNESFKFSRDLVTGAVRVSAVQNNARLFTWIPRPEILFPSTASDYSNYSSIITNASSGESYAHQYYNYTTKSLETLSSGLVTGTITKESEQRLAVLMKSDTTGYYEGSVDIYIWLEGCDKEARRAFVGGNFKVNLSLISEDIVA